MNGSLVAAACAALCLASAVPAAAGTLVTTTYTGQISAGQDWTGIFGTAMGNLAGADFSAVYLFDIDQPTRSTVAGVSDTVVGGGASSPFVSASLTIRGITYNFVGIDNGGAQVTNGNQIQHSFSQLDNDGVGLDYQLAMTNRFFGAPAVPSLLDTPFSTNVGLTQSSSFVIYQLNNNTMTLGAASWGNMSVSAVSSTVQTTGAVPEPATWAMMIMGFGAAGSMIRRRRRAQYA